MKNIDVYLDLTGMTIHNCSIFSDEDQMPPIFKDEAEIMWRTACGNGMYLACEMAKILGIDKYKVYDAFSQVLKETVNMTREEAWKKQEASPNLNLDENGNLIK